MALSEYLPGFFADFGVACSANGVGFTGILDKPDEQLSLSGVNVLSTMYLLALQSSDRAAASIATGTVVTVAGTTYTVRDVMLVDDGAITHLTLSR